MQTKHMADGLSHILKSLTWYMALSRLLLKDMKLGNNLAELRKEMENRFLNLYQSLLEYQIKCTLHRFHYGRIVSSAKAVIGLEDWESALKDIQKLEEAIRADTATYDDEIMKGLAAESNLYSEAMVIELRDANRGRQQKMTGKFNSNCKEYMTALNPKAVEGTCLWFSENSHFQNWIKDDSKLLIVSADAGCGKSVLSRHLVESVLDPEHRYWFTCHFFFKDVGDQKKLSTGLSCIVHQLLSQSEAFSEAARKKINEAGDGINSWYTLWDILLLLLKEIDNVIILFDAFDEMNGKDFKELTKEKLLSDLIAGSNTKIIITTRPYAPITDKLSSICSAGTVHLRGEGEEEIGKIQKEINLVVDHRLRELKDDQKLEDETMKALEKTFKDRGKDQKTYIWVKLAFELLENDKNFYKKPKYWSGLIEIISKDHIKIYEEFLQLVSTEDKEDVRTILSIILAADAPLTTQQMDIALAVRKQFLSDSKTPCENEKMLECRGERMHEWIRNTCRCFVTVYDSKVYFMHQTVKEFLLQQEPSSGVQPSSRSWHKSITMEQANMTFIESWIAYICIMQFPKDRQNFHTFTKRFLTDGLLRFRNCQVFEPPGTTLSNEASIKTVSDVSEHFQSSYYALWDQPIKDQSPWLHEMYIQGCWGYGVFNSGLGDLFQAYPFPAFNIIVASFFGHYNVLVHLVSKHRDLHNTDRGNAVTAAAIGGNLECLQYLLSQQYPANPPFKLPEQVKNNQELSGAYSEVFGTTALHWAAIWGNCKMAQLLLTNGAEVNTYSQEDKRTPVSDTIRGYWTNRPGYSLQRAKYLGRMSGLQEVRADPMPVPSGCNESEWEKSLMKLFLENGANLETALLDDSMLYHAIYCNDENAIDFLLHHCQVDLNKKGWYKEADKFKITPLHLALEKCSNRVCSLLLKAGADASLLCTQPVRGSSGDPPILDNVSSLHVYLQRYRWDEKLLEDLLKSGGKRSVNTKIKIREIDTEEYDAEAPLLQLDKLGESWAWGGATCLHRVVTRTFELGHHSAASCIKQLVRNGAEIDEPNDAGETALHLACQGNNLSIAITLLELGADPTLKDQYHRTPQSTILKWDIEPNERRRILELCEPYLNRLSHKTTGSTDLHA